MKHDHKKTKKLKVALFSMFMFLPFIAIGITCLTHVFNKEVAEDTQTATINYKYELGTENPPTKQSAVNKLYKIEQINTTFDLYKIEYITDGTTTAIEKTNEIYVYFNNNGAYTNDFEFTYPVYIVLKDIEETNEPYNNFLTPPQNNDYNLIENVTITTNPQDQTTNIFYDSCTQVQQSFILNWCNTNNPLRTTLNNFTQIVALPNTHLINDLLTYWLSLTIIYIIIDIILELVIYLTHMFNKEV